MKEAVFLNRNSERWKAYENMLQGTDKENPDKLAELFIQITDDLAYARTYYPKSEVVKYLNSLAFRSHQLIYVNKKENKKRVRLFWVKEYPLLLFEIRKYIIYSLMILLVSISIGVVSTLNDDTFVRLILGDSYVNMTISNIDKGDPLAVYKNMNEADMFLGITFNNIKVSFVAFLFGIFLSVGAAFIIFQNGIMLGAFLTFFYQKGLLWNAMSVIWIHGTLEIFAIVVAGAAGLIMGNSILFPGTYKRITSFKMGVNKALKTVLGVAPLFIVAGFLEGFITRYTLMPMIIKLSIIGLSLLFIVGYFFIYPVMIFKNSKNLKPDEPNRN